MTDIVWETDGASPVLPSEAWVDCNGEDDIANILSTTYGWLVADFTITSRDATEQ